ncbi:MAG: hypothetical protein ACKOTH_11640, partial [Solirubrobacterales bacterium]
MGLLDRYRQFQELSPEEVSAGLREEADERRRKALARVGELDLSRTTWHEYPPSVVVDAITFTARRGLHRYADAAGELRAALAHRHGIGAERVAIGDGASQLLSSAARRAAAAAPRRKALARVGELDLSRTTWHEYPPSVVVDAITFTARRG